jgi:serine/threonine-protein kinase PknK
MAKKTFLTGATLSRRYHLERLLGSGGMGDVYLARDTAADDSLVAIKTLKDRETVDWFKREFETLSLMVHPHIARVFNFDRDRDRDVYFYTCEYVAGRPADEALADSAFPIKLDVFGQILRALQYIHGQGYLHCDVKPMNVLVLKDPADGSLSAKVLDFGLAMSIPRSSMTARGTFSYMAPEWLEGGVPGTYTDIYSTGVMFYQSTYGKLPFIADGTTGLVDFKARREMDFPSLDGVPDWWPNVLQGMTAREIPDRVPTIRECLGAISRRAGEVLAGPAAELSPEAGVGGPWIGRGEALNTASTGIREALAGTSEAGSFLVVRGGPGIGKSRFLGELKRRMQLSGIRVIAGDAGHAQGAFGALSARVGKLADDTEPGLPSDRIEHVVQRRVQQTLDYSANRTLLFLVDDGQLLDEHSAVFFAAILNAQAYALAEDLPPFRMAVVMSAGLTDDLSARLPSRGRLDIELDSLNSEEATRFLQLALGVIEIPDSLRDEAASLCGGNPRLLQEFALFVRDCEALEHTPGGIVYRRDRLPASGIPTSVEQYVRNAWDNFGEPERKLLTVLAILFRPQPFPILAQLAEVEVWQVDQIVATLAERGVITFVQAGERSLPVVEGTTLRRLAADALTAKQTKALHRRIANTLENDPANRRVQQSTIAVHALRSGDTVRARANALAGADAELAESRFEHALELIDVARATGVDIAEVAARTAAAYRLWGQYEAGCQALVPLLEEMDDRGTRDIIAVQLAELYFHRALYDDARMLLEPLSADEDSAQRGAALALMARVHFYSGRHAQSRKTAERGMLALDSATRDFALCAAMVGLVRVYEGKLQQGAKYLETSESVLVTAGSGSDQSFAANAVGIAYHKLKDYEAATESYQRSLDTARRCGDLERINIATMNLSVVHQEAARYGEAITRYEEALAMAWQADNHAVLARVYNNLGNIHRYLGMLHKAQDLAERSVELADRLGLGLACGLNRMLLGEILTLQGRFEVASPLFAEARKLFADAEAIDEILECDIDSIELHVAAEEYDSAVKLGEETVAAAEETKLDNHRLRAIAVTATALLRRNNSGDPGHAMEILDVAADLLDEFGTPELEFRVNALLAQALTSLGNAERAAGILAQAERSLTALKRLLPEEFHSGFFNRADRKLALSDFAGVSSRVAQLAHTIAPMAQSSSRLHRRHRWMAELIRMNERLVAQHDLEKLLETLIDVVVNLSGAERGFVLLAASEGLDVVVARNMDREVIRRSRTKFSTTIARKVLAEGEVIRLEDAIEADDFRSKESVMALRIRSVMCLPIVGKGETVGAIYLDNRFKPGVFSESVIEMLTAFAEQASIAIQNAQMLARYRETVQALEKSQEEVKRLNERLEEKVRFQEAVIEQKTEELDRRQEQLEERYRFQNIVGRSRAVEALFAIMQRVCQTHVPVLITGESGSGKELVARALHFSGPRRKNQYLSINCAALPDGLLESELFGHEEGAFTDARRARKGLFDQAHEGTLFLDEVGDMSLTMQAKLLRVLQEGEVAPLGAEGVHIVDVRILAATNRNLKAMVKAGSFRQDLYFRLDVVSVRVPSLRERKEDIPMLVNHFLDQFASKSELPRPTMSMQAMQVLMGYHWPGNVRELQSVVTTSAVFANDGVITTESLRTKPEVFQDSAYASTPISTLETVNLRELEKQAVIMALRRTEGNKQKAAKVLGISRRALYNKLESHQIDTDRLF